MGHSQNNKKLAAMIADFAQVTNKSTGRTVTKVCGKEMTFVCHFPFILRTVLLFWKEYRNVSQRCSDLFALISAFLDLYPVSISNLCTTFLGRESPITAFPIKCQFLVTPFVDLSLSYRLMAPKNDNELVTVVEQGVYPVPDIPIKDLLAAIP